MHMFSSTWDKTWCQCDYNWLVTIVLEFEIPGYRLDCCHLILHLCRVQTTKALATAVSPRWLLEFNKCFHLFISSLSLSLAIRFVLLLQLEHLLFRLRVLPWSEPWFLRQQLHRILCCHGDASPAAITAVLRWRLLLLWFLSVLLSAFFHVWILLWWIPPLCAHNMVHCALLGLEPLDVMLCSLTEGSRLWGFAVSQLSPTLIPATTEMQQFLVVSAIWNLRKASPVFHMMCEKARRLHSTQRRSVGVHISMKLWEGWCNQSEWRMGDSGMIRDSMLSLCVK